MKMKRAEYHSRLGGVENMQELKQAIWDADDHMMNLKPLDVEGADAVKLARIRQAQVAAPKFTFAVNKRAEAMREAHAAANV